MNSAARHKGETSPRGRFLVIVLAFLVNQSVSAGEWRITPALELGETFTDNVELAPPGEEEWDLITQVNPRLSVHGEGRRLKLDFDYRMQNLFFLREPESNSTNHQLQAAGNAEIIENLFFVDASSNIGQAIISPEGRIPSSTVTGAGNLTDVATFDISPYLRTEFRGVAEGELRYRYDRVLAEEGVSDSSINEISARVNSGREFTRLRWLADYLNRTVERESGDDAHYESALGDVRYGLTRRLSAVLRFGYENNDFETTGLTVEDGAFWSAGLAWQPNRALALEGTYGPQNKDAALTWTPNIRNTLRVAYQNRDVGLNPGGNWSGTLTHRARRSTWEASYQEGTTTTQELLATPQLVNLFDPETGEIILNPDDVPVLVPRDVLTLTDEVIVRKRFEARVEFRTKKSVYALRGFREKQEPQPAGDEDLFYGADASWRWRLARRTESLSRVEWQRSAFDEDDRTDDLWYFQAGLNRRIRRNVSGSINYFYTQRISDREEDEYKENRITLLVNVSF